MSIQHSKVGARCELSGGMPMFSPSFAVKGQHAFVAISPVALNAAIAQAEQGPAVVACWIILITKAPRAKLPEEVVAVTYEDTRQLAASAYAMLTVIGPMLAGRADAPIDRHCCRRSRRSRRNSLAAWEWSPLTAVKS